MVSIIFTVHIHVSSTAGNLRFLQCTHLLQKRHIASEGLFFPGGHKRNRSIRPSKTLDIYTTVLSQRRDA